MSKKLKAKVKMRIQAGKATPAPPVGSALGQHKVKIMDFCKEFNAKTTSLKGKIPVKVAIYEDLSFDMEIKTPPAVDMIKEASGVSKGAADPKREKVGTITSSSIEKIARVKMEDLNAFDIEQAKKIIAGSARSMGIEVVD